MQLSKCTTLHVQQSHCVENFWLQLRYIQDLKTFNGGYISFSIGESNFLILSKVIQSPKVFDDYSRPQNLETKLLVPL